MCHYFLAVEVGEGGISFMFTVRCSVPIAKAFLVQLAFSAVCREVSFDIKARVGSTRTCPLSALFARICVIDDVQKHGLQVSLVLSLLVNYPSLFRIDLQLNLIDLAFGVLAVHLIVHSEERQDRHDISKDEV